MNLVASTNSKKGKFKNSVFPEEGSIENSVFARTCFRTWYSLELKKAPTYCIIELAESIWATCSEATVRDSRIAAV